MGNSKANIRQALRVYVDIPSIWNDLHYWEKSCWSEAAGAIKRWNQLRKIQWWVLIKTPHNDSSQIRPTYQVHFVFPHFFCCLPWKNSYITIPSSGGQAYTSPVIFPRDELIKPSWIIKVLISLVADTHSRCNHMYLHSVQNKAFTQSFGSKKNKCLLSHICIRGLALFYCFTELVLGSSSFTNQAK